MPTLLDDTSSYQEQEKAFQKYTSKFAKTTKSDLLKKVSTETASQDDQDTKNRCRLAYMLVEEMLDEYKEGEMTWEEAVDDLMKALKTI